MIEVLLRLVPVNPIDPVGENQKRHRSSADFLEKQNVHSGDSWMYPYQRTPVGNPYISPIYPYIVGVYGLLSPRIPI